jgi:hypothetical protein
VRVAGSDVFDVNSTGCNSVAATRLTVQKHTNVGKIAGASTRLYPPCHRAMLPVMKAVITVGGGQQERTAAGSGRTATTSMNHRRTSS